MYTWGGSVVGQDGKATPVTGTFSTVKPNVVVNSQFQLSDGQTVGIAAPIILQFDAPISDKAAVEKALTVTTIPPVEGSWAWLPDEARRLARATGGPGSTDPAGTTVHVDAKLYGVGFGDDNYGAADFTLDIHHRPPAGGQGRRRQPPHPGDHRRRRARSTSRAATGEADLPRNITRSGIHVVTEKYSDFYMSNPAARYSDVHERWAVRISNNGEFIHANPASSGAQGNTNVTNGCINLSTDDAEQYFGSAVYGDPVEVTGTSIDAVLRRRRHLGLGGGLGHLGVDVGAPAAERGPGADVDPEHRAGDADRRADAVGHPDTDDDLEFGPGDRYRACRLNRPFGAWSRGRITI